MEDRVQTAPTFFPPGCYFHPSAVPGREKLDSFFFFPSLFLSFACSEEEEETVCVGSSGQEARAADVMIQANNWVHSPWQQSCLSVTVLPCQSPLVIEMISAALCRVNESEIFLSCMDWCRAMILSYWY